MTNTAAKGYLSPSSIGIKQHLCVLPCGGLADEYPLVWSKDRLQFYVNYMLNDIAVDRLFQGFVLTGIRMRESHFIHPMYVGFGEASTVEDWERWLDVLFTPDANLLALRDLAGIEPLDIWVSVPYPHPFQQQFGVVSGRMLDFRSDVDRFAAVVWWIDRFMQRWQEEGSLHAKLRFKGFLWQREAIDANDESIVKWLNGAVGPRGVGTLWLPNYGSYGVLKWKEYGFQAAALHTNYSGNTSYDTSWIRNTASFAAHYGMGLQMVYGSGLIYNETHPLDYWNLGLPEYSGYMNRSLLVYQFPNTSADAVCRDKPIDYIRLYTFTKGLYQKVDYPNIDY